MPNQVPLVEYKLVDTTDTQDSTIQEKFGYVPYGNGDTQVMVRVSSKMGDPVLWTYLMSIGAAAFFGTEYVIVRGASLQELVYKVEKRMRHTSYLLHGIPTVENKVDYCQMLLAWEPKTSVIRSRQLLGTFMVDHISSKIEYDKDKKKEEMEAKKNKSVGNGSADNAIQLAGISAFSLF